MNRFFKGAALALTLVVGGLFSSAAGAATVVDISLWDKGAGTAMGADMAYGTPGLDMSKATMGIKVSTAVAKAGLVTFHVTNTSTDTIHEMIVIYLADPSLSLPYIAGEQKVDEDKAGDKGEVSELDPGAEGTLTLALKAGKYLLICNIPGHFAAGMWTEFEVIK